MSVQSADTRQKSSTMSKSMSSGYFLASSMNVTNPKHDSKPTGNFMIKLNQLSHLRSLQTHYKQHICSILVIVLDGDTISVLGCQKVLLQVRYNYGTSSC